MPKYAYEDEDNAPMNADAFDGAHNPTVYNSRSEMKAIEALPFDDPGGENCHEYCPYASQCKHTEGAINLEPENCDIYYRLDAENKYERAVEQYEYRIGK